jgi:SAM-dependent methyltransferase
MSYNEDYFERGLQTGKSTYENYRWMPELTIPFVYEIIRYCDILRCHSILDFGCAKGYYVKSFRLLQFNAQGVDISKYAIDNAPDDIKKYVFLLDEDMKDFLKKFPIPFDWVISKDVFEHLNKKDLVKILDFLRYVCTKMFVIVPLGKDGKYNASLNDKDPTHKICEDYNWWCRIFVDNGWILVRTTTHVDHLKPLYKGIKDAHGFYTLKRK